MEMFAEELFFGVGWRVDLLRSTSINPRLSNNRVLRHNNPRLSNNRVLRHNNLRCRRRTSGKLSSFLDQSTARTESDSQAVHAAVGGDAMLPPDVRSDTATPRYVGPERTAEEGEATAEHATTTLKADV